MIQLDVRNHGYMRTQQQERTIALVRLGNGEVARTRARIGSRIVQAPADEKRRILARRPEDRYDHRSSGGLTVGSRYDDRPMRRQQRSEGLSPTHDLYACAPGG